MIRTLLLSGMLAGASLLHAQLPSLAWANSINGLNTDWCREICVDNAGNVYATGLFEGATADLDPDPVDSLILNSVNGTQDMFLCKYDPNGALLWAYQFGGSNHDQGYALATDQSGNVYMAGHFQGSVDFDPTANVTLFNASGATDIAIVKLNANGGFVWAQRIGGSDYDIVESIAIDVNNSLLVTGSFRQTVDFDPGPGTQNLTANGTFNDDIFILKMTSGGSFVWVKQFGAMGLDHPYDLTTDASGNIYAGGYFEQTVDFDPGSGVANLAATLGSDAFILKLDGNGDYTWAKAYGGNMADEIYGITTDANGNVFAIGDFWSASVTFGSTTLTSAGQSEAVLCKHDASGNLLWAAAISGSDVQTGRVIRTDTAGYIYVCGYFNGPTDFDPGAGTASQSGAENAYLAKLDANANLVWYTSIGAAGTDDAMTMQLDDSANIYIGGYFENTVDFDFNSGTFNLAASGYDMYVLKLNGNQSMGIPANLENGVKVYPNPAHDQLTIETETPEGIAELIDLSGRVVKTTAINTNVTRIDVNDLAEGMYVCRVNGTATAKVEVIR